MKQKRKGASLFSSKKRLEIVSLLGILWWVLCIASVWLLNKSAMAAAWDTTTMKLDYTWIGDDTEVVYNVSFVSETDNSKDLLNIYKKDSNLYITPNNVVVNPSTAGVISRFNKVEWGVYGHVLWWNGNRISSANVTIIAWESNVVNSNNANATILWWKQNVLYAGSGSRVAVLVWWYNNRVYNSNNPVNLIWWRNNEISDAASNAPSGMRPRAPEHVRTSLPASLPFPSRWRYRRAARSRFRRWSQDGRPRRAGRRAHRSPYPYCGTAHWACGSPHCWQRRRWPRYRDRSFRWWALPGSSGGSADGCRPGSWPHAVCLWYKPLI